LGLLSEIVADASIDVPTVNGYITVNAYSNVNVYRTAYDNEGLNCVH